MDRETLIEKARAAGWGRYAGMLADICMPLLAAERERAIEECARIVEKGGSHLAHKSGLAHQIRALRAPNDKPEAGSGECKPAEATADRSTTRDASSADASPPALHSDADTLERAAEILERDKALPWRPEIATDIRHVASQLRARPAPQGDWADEIAADYWSGIPDAGERNRLAALLRERFGPCVEFLAELAAMHESEPDWITEKARAALARLKEQ